MGVLVGDSLGAGVEGDSPGAVRDRWRDPAALASLEPGPYSAVSEMTLALAASLAADPEFDGEDFARRLLAGANLRRGYGEGTRRALELLRAGAAWNEAAATFPGRGCSGNAASARGVPVGLAGVDPDWLRWLAEEQASVTHAHGMAAEGAVVVATATALLLEAAGRDLDPERFLERVAAECQLRELRERIAGAAGLLGRPLDAARAVSRLGNNATTLGSVATGLYCFAVSPEDFVGAVTAALRLGGNATSIAAMAGGYAGAFLGLAAIPERWIAGLEHGSVSVEGLCDAADGILAGAARTGRN